MTESAHVVHLGFRMKYRHAENTNVLATLQLTASSDIEAAAFLGLCFPLPHENLTVVPTVRKPRYGVDMTFCRRRVGQEDQIDV